LEKTNSFCENYLYLNEDIELHYMQLELNSNSIKKIKMKIGRKYIKNLLMTMTLKKKKKIKPL
jgi:hypothetical protein